MAKVVTLYGPKYDNKSDKEQLLLDWLDNSMAETFDSGWGVS